MRGGSVGLGHVDYSVYVYQWGEYISLGMMTERRCICVNYLPMRSTTRLEYPHSLSYHAISLTNLGLSMMPALESNTDEMGQDTKSCETRSSSV